MSSVVLDASAVIALFRQERGSDVVEQAVADGAAISAVNLAEVAAKLHEAGMADEALREALAALDMEVVAFDRAAAYRSGLLRAQTRGAGLSLGDRACLALAQQLGLPALTTDRVWTGLQVGVPIRLIR